MKILVAEDDPLVQQLLLGVLSEWHYQVLLADDGLQAMQLAEDNPDLQLFIVDWSMPWLDGLSFCKKLKQTKRSAYVIMLSARSSTNDLVTAMEEGVDDFIAKPFVAEELRVRLRVGRRILAQERRLSHMANFDELTGVLNRRMLLETLEREWWRAKRDKSDFALMFFDLDHFKQINDRFGHVVGDEVLKHFCATVMHQLRPYDQFGRYGGEEFTLLLPNTNQEGAISVAERIRGAIHERPFLLDSNQPLKYTASIGIAVKTEDELSIKTLIQRADAATYVAKNNGRDQVAFLSAGDAESND